MKRPAAFIPYFIIALLGAVVFIPFLGEAHLFDWDEVNFAESAREMIVTGNYSTVQINFLPFWQKPPLFIWMQVLSMKVFGINEFAARFPNAVCGILTLMVLFRYGKKYFDARMGWLWVMVYTASLLPHFYFKSGIIDPWFNLFMLLAIFQLVGLTAGSPPRRWPVVLLAGMFLGLAILTKGPVGLLIPMLCLLVYIIVSKNFKLVGILELGAMVFVAAVVSSPWYAFETAKTGWWFLEEFINYHLQLMQTEDAGHGGPFYYHFVVLLLGCFPASFFMFPALRHAYTQTPAQHILKRWMLIVLAVVLVLFSIVETKIIHYSSMTYFPVTFLAALYLRHLSVHAEARNGWLRRGVFVFTAILAVALFAVPYIGTHTQQIIPYIKDPFAVGNLMAAVHWPWFTYLAGVAALVTVVSWLVLSGRQLFRAAVVLCAGLVVTLAFILVLFIPRIEGYTQGAAIEFFEKLSQADAYINVAGYKSYAHYFYGNKQPNDLSKRALDEMIRERQLKGELDSQPTSKQLFELELEWHLTGNIDKPVYIVTKTNKAPYYRSMPQLQEIGSKNGFVFFLRQPYGF